MTIDVSPVNDPPTGKPVISGVRQVGETLTVAVDGIADVDGLPDTLSLQWLQLDIGRADGKGQNSQCDLLDPLAGRGSDVGSPGCMVSGRIHRQ